jgi:hypothetical protein
VHFLTPSSVTFLRPTGAGLFPAVSISEENFADFNANFDYQFTPFGAVPEHWKHRQAAGPAFLRTKARPLRAAPLVNE